MIVEARQYKVILMKDMHPMTTRTLDTAVPRIRQTSVFRLAVKCYPSRSKAASNFKRYIITRAVIYYLDLHLVSTETLLENTIQSFLQIIWARVVRRNHNRPERARGVDSQCVNYRRFESSADHLTVALLVVDGKSTA